MLNALRTAIRKPNSTKVMKIDSSVKVVRILRRIMLRQTMCRNFMPQLP